MKILGNVTQIFYSLLLSSFLSKNDNTMLGAVLIPIVYLDWKGNLKLKKML